VPTDVDICNLALSRVRADSIGSFTENSQEAVQCNILYALTRDHLLTSFSWGFAKETRALSLTGGTAQEWLYEYDYPNNCLRIHYIIPPESGKNIVSGTGIATPRIDYEPIPYEVGVGENGSRVILTDYDDAYISYTKSVTDTRLFDPLFVQSLAWLLAIDLAIPLGGDSGAKYRDDAERGYMKSMEQAIAHSANENEDGRQRLPRSIQARHGAVDRDYFYGDLSYRRY
jgi:hypothetical protein